MLGDVFTSTEFLGTPAYTEHPDVDLACLNVSAIGRPEYGVFHRHVRIEQLATFQEPWFIPNAEVCFIGYPDGRYDQKNNLPIMRRGAVASMPRVPFNGAKHFVVDAHVHKGSSGSPVFIMPPPFSAGEVRLVGVLTQTMIRGAELVPIAQGARLGVEQTIGLGIVLNAELVRELVNAAVAKLLPPESEGARVDAA